jgi:DNA-binding PadR family transcriptional regulator
VVISDEAGCDWGLTTPLNRVSFNVMPRSPRITHAGLRQENDPLVLVLLSLLTGAKHGYALVTDIQEFSGILLGPGTLYGALNHLEQAGLVQALELEGRRRPYRITDTGVLSVREVLDAMENMAGLGRRRLSAISAREVRPGLA